MEVPLLPSELCELLGYSCQADVLLEQCDGERRLWIEFEVSRADPVANHAKFSTSNLFCPLPPASTFVSMVSTHVTRGRRNLAAATVHLMRRLGMDSYQTTLLPDRAPDEIKRLNHLTLPQLESEDIPVSLEIARAMAVSEPVFEFESVRVHYPGELLDVMLSVRRFNIDLATDHGRRHWGRRRVRYFVYDPATNQFAPSKFCGYLPVLTRFDEPKQPVDVLASREMTTELYGRIETTAKLFDGTKAWTHLTRHLGMTMHRVSERPELADRFSRWLKEHADAVILHPRGPEILLPPAWFQ